MPQVSLDATALRIIAVIAALLIFFMPRLLNYAVAGFFLAVGIYGPSALTTTLKPSGATASESSTVQSAAEQTPAYERPRASLAASDPVLPSWME